MLYRDVDELQALNCVLTQRANDLPHFSARRLAEHSQSATVITPVANHVLQRCVYAPLRDGQPRWRW